MVLKCLALAIFLGFVTASVTSQDLPPAPGRFVNVGGHRMHFACAGAGSLTVVVENGLGDFSTDWSLVQPLVAAFTRICTYDRAGYAWSEPGPMPRTFDQLNVELHEGLKLLGEHGPFVLVGHSYGGLVIRHYAQIFPDDFSGMVLVETIHEDQRIPMGPAHAGLIRDDAKGRVIPAPRLAIRPEEKSVKAVPPSTEPLDPLRAKLSKQNQLVDSWAAAQPALEAAENSQKEWSAEYLAVMHNTPQKRILRNIPLIVLTRAQGGYDDRLGVPGVELEAERLHTQKLPADLSTNSVQLIVPSGHEMHLEVPEVVASAIHRVVLAVRTHQPLRQFQKLKIVGARLAQFVQSWRAP